MAFYFHKDHGFLLDHRHTIPDESHFISDEYHKELFDGQSEGMKIQVNENGFPVLVKEQGPSDEEAASKIRDMRNRLIAKTDWTQLPDVPQSLKSVYSEYRQQLRDIPEQKGFPNDIVWPVDPKGES